MSGYDPKTGIFELSWNKMSQYLGHRGEEFIDPKKAAIELIEGSPHEYLGETPYGLKLVASYSQVWELLSGKPSTLSYAEPAEDPYLIYQKWKRNRKWFNATELGKEFSPPIGAANLNRRLKKIGAIKIKDKGWAGTSTFVRKGLVKKRDSTALYGSNPCVWLNVRLIDILNEDSGES